MSNDLQAKSVIEALKKVQDIVRKEKKKYEVPIIGIIRVGQDSGNIFFHEAVANNCCLLGIQVKSFVVEGTIIMEDFIWLINEIKNNYSFHSILVLGAVSTHIRSK